MSVGELFEQWCVLELMGHRKLGGYVREQTIAGVALIRIDVPGESGPMATQFYSPAAVYCITPTTEEVARTLARSHKPEPVTRWELPAGPARADVRGLDDAEVEDEDTF